MNAFFWSLKEINGAYDPHHRKVTITLTSSADAKIFFETFARQATDVDELDVVFEGWNFWASDLENLVKSVCQTNVKSLKLDLKDSVNDTISEISARFTPGSKYQPLFDLLWNRKLQGFSLIGAGGFGLRTSDFPMGQHFSYLQSFHFLHAIKTSDQLRLMKILTYCRNLTDLRLGDYVNWSKIRQELVSVMAAMEYIRTLHLYSVQGQSGGSVSGLLYAFANKATPLKELVCYVGRVNEWELGEVIRSLSRKIEVLISMGYLEVILKDLNLVHLGLTSPTKSLLNYVNYPTLRSVSLLDFEEADLKPLKDYVQNCNNPTHLEVISLQGAKFSNPWKFAPLLNTLTLKRLQLSGMSSPELKGTISVMNMTRLECLVLVGCHYDWAVEETLAAKRAEFRPELLLHVSIATREGVSHQQAVEEKGIDKVESREACDTAVKLAARRVRFYSAAELVLLGKPLLGVF
ncbi:hypothetical protein BGZ97_003136 [Linnemannia gamsii]|uniref:Uncharacterized protein n=1 Tax=Linnemannia gamsii TaxID=64522 RepID=A0A9P6QVL6_9FUNG|nr:hypothetical protein BGZ97_003136 [Linnemannia gamsii]